MLLRNFKNWNETEIIMSKLSCTNIKTANRWALTCSESEDPSAVLNHKRGGSQSQTFYENYPDIEKSAKAFSIIETSKKNCEFSVQILQQYITGQFKELVSKEEVVLNGGRMEKNRFILDTNQQMSLNIEIN